MQNLHFREVSTLQDDRVAKFATRRGSNGQSIKPRWRAVSGAGGSEVAHGGLCYGRFHTSTKLPSLSVSNSIAHAFKGVSPA